MSEEPGKEQADSLKSRIEGDINSLKNQIVTKEIVTLFIRTGIDALAMLGMLFLILLAASKLSICMHPDKCPARNILLLTTLFTPVCYLGSMVSTTYTQLPLRQQGPALCSFLLIAVGALLLKTTDRYRLIALVLFMILISSFAGYRHGIRRRKAMRR